VGKQEGLNTFGLGDGISRGLVQCTLFLPCGPFVLLSTQEDSNNPLKQSDSYVYHIRELGQKHCTVYDLHNNLYYIIFEKELILCIRPVGVKDSFPELVREFHSQFSGRFHHY
jgi:hypothetical protein